MDDRSSLANARLFALDQAWLDHLLAEQYECTLSWVNRDGHPLAVTCAFVYEDGRIWMVSVDHRARTRALQRDPRAAVTVSSLGTSMGRSKTVTFKGVVEVVLGDDDLNRHVLQRIVAQYDPDDEEKQRRHFDAAWHPGRCVLKFTPEKVTNTFDGSKVVR